MPVNRFIPRIATLTLLFLLVVSSTSPCLAQTTLSFDITRFHGVIERVQPDYALVRTWEGTCVIPAQVADFLYNGHSVDFDSLEKGMLVEVDVYDCEGRYVRCDGPFVTVITDDGSPMTLPYADLSQDSQCSGVYVQIGVGACVYISFREACVLEHREHCHVWGNRLPPHDYVCPFNRKRDYDHHPYDPRHEQWYGRGPDWRSQARHRGWHGDNWYHAARPQHRAARHPQGGERHQHGGALSNQVWAHPTPHLPTPAPWTHASTYQPNNGHAPPPITQPPAPVPWSHSSTYQPNNGPWTHPLPQHPVTPHPVAPQHPTSAPWSHSATHRPGNQQWTHPALRPVAPRPVAPQHPAPRPVAPRPVAPPQRPPATYHPNTTPKPNPPADKKDPHHKH